MEERESSLSQPASNSLLDQTNLRTFKRRPRPSEPKLPTTVPTAVVSPPAEPSTKRAKLSSATKPKKQLTQVHLDFGQKNFHSTQCPTCGLIYTPGKATDDRLHAAYHNKNLQVPRYSAGREDVTVATDGSIGDIVRISTATPSKAMKDLVGVLETELGLVPGWLLAVPGTAFLYVCRKTRAILGCIVAENITEARTASFSSSLEEESSEISEKNKIDGHSVSKNSNNSGGSSSGVSNNKKRSSGGVVLVDNQSSRRVRHGIRMMWTCEQARRKSIATKLLNCARCQLVRGYVLPRGDLAFSQPTPAGAAFVQAYSGAKEFLVYSAQSRQ